MSLPEKKKEPPQRREMTPVIWLCFFGAVNVGLAHVLVALKVDFTLVSPHIALEIGLAQLFFIIYVTYASKKSRKVEKREDDDEIREARRLTEQCESMREAVKKSLNGGVGDYRTHMALIHLASKIRFFVSQYRRYITKTGADRAFEAENMIIRAGLTRDGDLEERIASLGPHIKAIKAHIRDEEDADLRDKRMKMYGGGA